MIIIKKLFFVAMIVGSFLDFGFSVAFSQSLKPEAIMAHMKIRLNEGVTKKDINGYRMIVRRLDLNQDGNLSLEEYSKNKHFRNNPAGTRGFFMGADSNRDGLMSLNEYAWQRIITDEAKVIYFSIDLNGDRRVSYGEFLKNKIIKDQSVSEQVFRGLDTNGDNEIILSEYLRVWSQLARVGRRFQSLY